MSRFSSIVLFLALVQFAWCHVVTPLNPEDERNYIISPTDVAVKEKREEVIPEPVRPVGVARVIVINNTAGTKSSEETSAEDKSSEKCAKVGEFCVNHKDCCSNACLGFLKRCVSGKSQLAGGEDVEEESED